MSQTARWLGVVASLGAVVLVIAACRGTGTESMGKDSRLEPDSAVRSGTKLIQVEVIDRTPGQSLSIEQRKAITEEVHKRVRELDIAIYASNQEDQPILGILRASIDVFSTRSTPTRSWGGFEAGGAQLKFTAEWIDGGTKKVEDSKEFRRFGAAFLRSPEAIEKRMVKLIGEYSKQFVSPHLK